MKSVPNEDSIRMPQDEPATKSKDAASPRSRYSVKGHMGRVTAGYATGGLVPNQPNAQQDTGVDLGSRFGAAKRPYDANSRVVSRTLGENDTAEKGRDSTPDTPPASKPDTNVNPEDVNPYAPVHGGGQTDLKRGYARGGMVGGYAKGGRPIGPVKKGALHSMMGIPQSEHIPAKKLSAAKNSDNPLERKRANFAINAKKWNH